MCGKSKLTLLNTQLWLAGNANCATEVASQIIWCRSASTSKSIILPLPSRSSSWELLRHAAPAARLRGSSLATLKVPRPLARPAEARQACPAIQQRLAQVRVVLNTGQCLLLHSARAIQILRRKLRVNWQQRHLTRQLHVADAFQVTFTATAMRSACCTLFAQGYSL